MITHVQIEQIAALPADADFRFERQFGETVVNCRYADGVEFSIREDGSHFVVTPSGACFSYSTEAMRRSMEQLMDHLDNRYAMRRANGPKLVALR